MNDNMIIERILDHSSVPALANDLGNCDEWLCFVQPPFQRADGFGGECGLTSDRARPTAENVRCTSHPWRLIRSAKHGDIEMILTIDDTNSVGNHPWTSSKNIILDADQIKSPSANRVLECRLDPGHGLSAERCAAFGEHDRGFGPTGHRLFVQELGFIAVVASSFRTVKLSPGSQVPSAGETEEPRSQGWLVDHSSAKAIVNAMNAMRDDAASSRAPSVRFRFVSDKGKEGPLWILRGIRKEEGTNSERIRLNFRVCGRGGDTSWISAELRDGLLYPRIYPNQTFGVLAAFPDDQPQHTGYRVVCCPSVSSELVPPCEPSPSSREEKPMDSLQGLIAAAQLASVQDLVDALRPYCGGPSVVRREFHFFDKDGKRGHPWRLLHAHPAGERLINLAIYPVGSDSVLKIIKLEMELDNDGLLRHNRTLQGTVFFVVLPEGGSGRLLIVPEPAESGDKMAKNHTTACRRCGSTVKVDLKMGWCLDCEPDPTLQGLIAAGQFASASNLVDVLKPYVRGSGTVSGGRLPYCSLDKDWADFLQGYTVAPGVSQFHFFDEGGRKGCSWMLMDAAPVKKKIVNDSPLGDVWTVQERLINLRVCPVGQNWATHTTELVLKLDNDGLLRHERTLRGAVFNSDKPIIPSHYRNGGGLLIVPEESAKPEDHIVTVAAGVDEIARAKAENRQIARTKAENRHEWKVQRILDHTSTPALARDLNKCESEGCWLGFVRAPNSYDYPTVEDALIIDAIPWMTSGSNWHIGDYGRVNIHDDAGRHHMCRWRLGHERGLFGVIEDSRDGVDSRQTNLGFIAVLTKQPMKTTENATQLTEADSVSRPADVPFEKLADDTDNTLDGILDHNSAKTLVAAVNELPLAPDELFCFVGETGRNGPSWHMHSISAVEDGVILLRLSVGNTPKELDLALLGIRLRSCGGRLWYSPFATPIDHWSLVKPLVPPSEDISATVRRVGRIRHLGKVPPVEGLADASSDGRPACREVMDSGKSVTVEPWTNLDHSSLDALMSSLCEVGDGGDAAVKLFRVTGIAEVLPDRWFCFVNDAGEEGSSWRMSHIATHDKGKTVWMSIFMDKDAEGDPCCWKTTALHLSLDSEGRLRHWFSSVCASWDALRPLVVGSEPAADSDHPSLGRIRYLGISPSSSNRPAIEELADAVSAHRRKRSKGSNVCTNCDRLLWTETGDLCRSCQLTALKHDATWEDGKLVVGPLFDGPDGSVVQYEPESNEWTVATYDDARRLHPPPPNRPLCEVCNTLLSCSEEDRGNVCSRCTERAAARSAEARQSPRIHKPWPRSIKILALLAVMVVAYNANCIIEWQAGAHARALVRRAATWGWVQSLFPPPTERSSAPLKASPTTGGSAEFHWTPPWACEGCSPSLWLALMGERIAADQAAQSKCEVCDSVHIGAATTRNERGCSRGFPCEVCGSVHTGSAITDHRRAEVAAESKWREQVIKRALLEGPAGLVIVQPPTGPTPPKAGSPPSSLLPPSRAGSRWKRSLPLSHAGLMIAAVVVFVGVMLRQTDRRPA